VDDVVTAILQSLTLPAAAGEAFNLGSEQPPTWNEYFGRYAQSLRALPARKITRTRLRLELGLYGPLLKIAEEALGPQAVSSRPAIRPRLIDLCQRDIRMNVRKAQESLGMCWRPLEQGLEESAQWFLAGGRTR
jgi:nucleoside-diphosphate-sugar epimerase